MRNLLPHRPSAAPTFALRHEHRDCDYAGSTSTCAYTFMQLDTEAEPGSSPCKTKWDVGSTFLTRTCGPVARSDRP